MTTIHDDDDEYGEHGRYPNPEPGEGWNAMIADAQINNDVVLTLEDLDEDITAILRNHISGKLKQHGNTALRLARKFTMDKPESERRFSWDGVGDAVFRPQYAIVPRPPVDEDPQMAHYWDCAIAMLDAGSKHATPRRLQKNEWTVQMIDPDEDPDDHYESFPPAVLPVIPPPPPPRVTKLGDLMEELEITRAKDYLMQ